MECRSVELTLSLDYLSCLHSVNKWLRNKRRFAWKIVLFEIPPGPSTWNVSSKTCFKKPNSYYFRVLNFSMNWSATSASLQMQRVSSTLRTASAQTNSVQKLSQCDRTNIFHMWAGRSGSGKWKETLSLVNDDTLLCTSL